MTNYDLEDAFMRACPHDEIVLCAPTAYNLPQLMICADCGAVLGEYAPTVTGTEVKTVYVSAEWP